MLKKIISLPIRILGDKASAFIFLLSIFFLGFVFSSYWSLPEKVISRQMLFLFILISGVIWAFISAGKTQFDLNRISVISFIVILIVVIVFNWKELGAAIPWRGDEDFHIRKTLTLMGLVQPTPIIVVFFASLLGIILLYKAPKVGFWYWLIGLGSLTTLFLITRPLDSVNAPFLLRYPFFSYWLSTVFVSIGSIFDLAHNEWVFRVISILSSAATIWVISKKIMEKDQLVGIFAAISIATIPVLIYYSSILYLEMPVVFLFCIVMLNMDQLLVDGYHDLKKNPGWIALILLGFIKETAFPILIGFLFLRWSIRLSRRINRLAVWFNLEDHSSGPQASFWSVIRDEISVAVSVLLPAALYLLLRMNLTQLKRDYNPSLLNLTDLNTYSVLLRSYFEQFGMFILLYVVGLIMFWITRKRLQFVFLTGLFVVVALFFALDNRLYLGYSRFNLLLLPILIVGALYWLPVLNAKNKAVTFLLIGSSLLINLILTPLLPDGTKKPFWGNYNTDTSEHYYPYPQVLAEVATINPNSRILFTGMYYPYYLEFYFEKLHWTADYTMEITKKDDLPNYDLASRLKSASSEGYDTVIYHVLGATAPTAISQNSGYISNVVCNLAHCLVVFTK